MDPNSLPKFVYLHKNHKYRLKLGFYAAPSCPKIFSKAIRDELHKLKFTYCSDLNGLIMGFGKISSNEVIAADIRHCINVAVNVDVFIFRPPVGSTIEAIVNQTSDNHISCLVHNLFNVSIVRPEHQPFNSWSGSKIKKDDKINVKVLSFDLTKKLPHITGEIVDNNENECNNSQDEIDNSSTYSFSKESLNEKNTKNVMDHITSSKTHDKFPKTSPLFQGKYKNEKENTENIIKQIEQKVPDSSSGDLESSSEKEHITFSTIHDIFTKTSPLFLDKIKDKLHNSSIKSINYNNTKNINKQIEKDSDSSSSDSESSNEMENITSLKTHDEFPKTSLLSQSIYKNAKKNTDNNIERIEKKNPDISSSDSESSNENQHITFPKTYNVFNKTSTSFKDIRDEQDNSCIQTKKHINTKNIMKPVEKEYTDSSSRDSKSSNKMETIILSKTHEKLPKTSPVYQGKFQNAKNNIENIKQIDKKGPDGSSSDSESSSETENITFSTTRDVFTKTPTLSEVKFKDFRDEQDISPIQSINDNNSKNVMKTVGKEDTDSSSGDSESSNENNNTSINHNVFTKTPTLSKDKFKDFRDEQDISFIQSINDNNKAMKTVKKEDTDSSSSDSESSNEMENIISSNTHNALGNTSPLFQESTRDKNTKDDLKQKEKEDTDNSSSNSEYSNATNPIQTNFNIRNAINGPLFSSTPNSEHGVNSIGLGRNKLQEQLRKHLAKNRIPKQNSFDSIKSQSKLIKDNLKMYDNLPATSVNNYQNIDRVDKIKLQNNMPSDSNISGDEPRQRKFPINNSITNPSIKSKTIKKNEKSDKIVSAILNSFSSDENNYETNITKNNLSTDCNAGDGKIEEVKNNMYTQQKHDLINLGNADQDILNHSKGPHTPIVRYFSALELSTKNVSSKKKDILDSKNDIENKLLQNQSNIKPSLISDLECNNSAIEDNVKQIQNNNRDNIPKTTIDITGTQYASSSDDEIYTKLQQNISKLEDKTKTCDQIKNQPFYEMFSSDDDSISPVEINHTSVSSLKNQNKSQQVDKMSNILQSSKCNNKNKLLPNKSCENDNTINFIQQILEEDSSIDDEINIKPLQSNITNECKIINKNYNQTPASSTLKLNENTKAVLNKDIVNPFIKFYTKNTCSSSEDDAPIFKLTKSTKKNCPSKKNLTPSVKKDEDYKSVLINKFLSSIQHKEKKPKKKLVADQINSNTSKKSKPAKTKKCIKDELKVKSKNKKDVLEKLVMPAVESKFNEFTSNTPKNNMLLSKIHISTNDSTDDEVDLIKKMNKSQKLNKNTDESESIFTNNIHVLPNKPNVASEKINTKLKSLKTSSLLTNNLINNSAKLKKKKSKESKDLLLNSILNSLESSSDHPPTKKKKKNDGSVIRSTDEFKEKNLDQNLIKAKKKKKICHDLIIETNDEFKDKISDQCLAKSTKKKRSHDLVNETNDKLKDKIADQSLSKTKKNKKDHNLVIETNDGLKNKSILKVKKKKDHNLIDELKEKISDQCLAKSKKKKKDQNLVIKMNDKLKDNISDQSLAKPKKKKKDHNLNDELKEKISDQCLAKTKKKKEDHDLVIEVNNELKDNISDQSLAKSKKKKKDHNLIVKLNDELKEKISDQCLAKSKKKKKDHDLVFKIKDELKDNIYDQYLAKPKKKKKDHDLVFKTNDELKDNISDQCLAKSNKKKKYHNSIVEMNDEFKDKIFNQCLDKTKKKKEDHDLVIEINNELKNKSVLKVKKKKDHNFVTKTYDEFVDKNDEKNVHKAKKKKKTKNSDCELTVQDIKNQCYKPSIMSHNKLSRENNLLKDVKKKKVKKDSILYDTQTDKITDILNKIEEEFENKNVNSKKTKKKKIDTNFNN